MDFLWMYKSVIRPMMAEDTRFKAVSFELYLFVFARVS